MKEAWITSMQPEDWEAVRAIYIQGLASGNASFETTAPDWIEWDSRHLKYGRLVARWIPTGQVVGWAALSPYSHRPVYAGVAEVSIYISPDYQGRGLGKQLLLRLIEEAENEGVWTLQAVLFPENTASLALHQACGFRQVGRRERIGKSGGIWRDVLLLERRSARVGR